MARAKTKRKLLGFTGDQDALNYGGGIVFQDEYGVHWWFWHEPEQEADPTKENFRVYRTDVPEDVFAYHNWADPFKIARTHGINPLTLQALGSSKRPMERVRALEMIASHDGARNLDDSPVTYSRTEMQRHVGPTLRAKVRSNPSRRRASYRSNPSGTLTGNWRRETRRYPATLVVQRHRGNAPERIVGTYDENDRDGTQNFYVNGRLFAQTHTSGDWVLVHRPVGMRSNQIEAKLVSR